MLFNGNHYVVINLFVYLNIAAAAIAETLFKKSCKPYKGLTMPDLAKHEDVDISLTANMCH
jgi:hypothetical protein